jgi:DHA3 family tetracycline resistance protein-like MFS transporter
LLALTARPDRVRQRTNVLQDIHAGVGVVLGIPWLWISIAFASLVNISYSGPWSVALPFLVKEHMHAGVGSLGLVYATLSLGFGLGAAWLGRSSRIRRRGLIAYGGWAVGGVMTLLLGLPLPLVASLAVVLVAGVAEAAFALIWTNTLQEMVPQELLGRVASVDSLGSFVLLPAGYGLACWATDRLGPSPVFIIGGGATLALAGLVLAHPAIRTLD